MPAQRAQYFCMSEIADPSKLGRQAAALKLVAATLELFDLCQPNSELFIELDTLGEVLMSKLDTGEKMHGIFKHLKGASNGQVCFLAYWQAMDCYVAEENGEQALHVPGDTVHGMQQFRDGVLEMTQAMDPPYHIASKDIVFLLREIRDGAMDPSYWDEVMAAVPHENGEWLQSSEVSEAVYVWLRDFVRSESENAASACDAERLDDTAQFARAFSRVSVIVDHYESDGASVQDLLEALQREAGPHEMGFQRALAHISTVVSTLQDTCDNQETHLSALQARNKALVEKLARAEDERDERDAEDYHAKEAIDMCNTAQKRTKTLEEERVDLHRQLDDMTAALRRAREEQDRKDVECTELRKREADLIESQRRMVEKLDEVEGREEWMHSRLVGHQKSGDSSDAEKVMMLTQKVEKLQKSLKSAKGLMRSYAESGMESEEVASILQKQVGDAQASDSLSATLNEVIADLKKTLASKESKLESAEDKVRDLEAALRESQARTRDRDSQVSVLQSKLENQSAGQEDSTASKCAEAAAATAIAAEALEDATREIDELKKKVALREEEAAKLREEKAQADEQREAARASRLSERRASASAAISAKAAAAERDAYEIQLREAEAALSKQSDSSKKLESKVTRQTAELEELKREVVGKDHDIQELKAKNSDMSQDLRAQADMVTSLSGELSELKSRYNDQSMKLANAKQRSSVKDDQLEKAQARHSNAARDVQLLENQLKAQQSEIDLLRASRDDILTASRQSPDGCIDESEFDPDNAKLSRENSFLSRQVATLLAHIREVEKMLDQWRDASTDAAPLPDARKRLSILHVQEENAIVFKELSQQLHTMEVQKNDLDQEFRRLQVAHQKQYEEITQLKDAIRVLERKRTDPSTPSIISTAYPFKGPASVDSDGCSSIAESASAAFLGSAKGVVRASPKCKTPAPVANSSQDPQENSTRRRLSDAIGATCKSQVLSLQALVELQREHKKKLKHETSGEGADKDATSSKWKGVMGALDAAGSSRDHVDAETKGSKKTHDERRESNAAAKTLKSNVAKLAAAGKLGKVKIEKTTDASSK